MSPAELVRRQERLLDLAAAPCLALADLVPKALEALASLEIGPTEVAGRVQLRVAAPFWLVELECAGDATERVAIPRWVLTSLARRHGDADRLVADAMGELEVGWRSFSASATVAVSGPRAELLPLQLPVLRPPWQAPGPGTAPALLAPALLKRAVAAAERLGCTHVELVPVGGGVLGAVLAVSGGADDLRGSIQVAAVVPAEAAAPREMAG